MTARVAGIILVVRAAAVRMEEPLTSSTPFSHAEWAHSNLEKYKRSEEARQRSEAIRNETIRLVEDRHIKTNRSQNEASNKLNERARDITTWKKDLQRELDLLVKETAELGKSNGSWSMLLHKLNDQKRLSTTACLPESIV